MWCRYIVSVSKIATMVIISGALNRTIGVSITLFFYK